MMIYGINVTKIHKIPNQLSAKHWNRRLPIKRYVFCVIKVFSLFIMKFLSLHKQLDSSRCEGEGV